MSDRFPSKPEEESQARATDPPESPRSEVVESDDAFPDIDSDANNQRVDALVTTVLHDSRLRTPIVSSFSLVVHVLLALLMACILFDPQGGDNGAIALVTTIGKESDVEEEGLEEEPAVEVAAVEEPEPEPVQPPEEEPPPPVEIEPPEEEVKELVTEETNLTTVVKPLQPIVQTSATGTGIREQEGADVAGRAPSARKKRIAAFGGTAESENAVQLGLEWMARHQRGDGSWSFNHIHGKYCRRECSSPGSLSMSQTGATAMALLSFLGAGESHVKGKYKREVYKGLRYLMQSMDLRKYPGDMRTRNDKRGNSGMYVQGLATMALCEALALATYDFDETIPDESNVPGGNDVDDPQFDDPPESEISKKSVLALGKRRVKVNLESLRTAAQLAVRFIEAAQDPQGGGWRYAPLSSGDTSVVGWQVMALQSARTAGVGVGRETFLGARTFLTSVASARGSRYGYRSPSANNLSMTAVGLLSQMYLGWDRDNPALEAGVSFLATRGPSKRDMYYNFYATQVMHHWGGPEWDAWNEKLRDHLVATQNQKRHAKGSWDVRDPHGGSGGRLYMTSLCIMTLEVYYRHMPLYRRLLDVDEHADAAAVTDEQPIQE